jgi:hypothetical protein
MPENVARHYQYLTQANINNLLSEGFEQPRSVYEGVPQYVNYLLKNMELLS